MRKLEIKYTYDGPDVYLHITEQTHRGREFAPHNSCYFRAKNGWRIESCSVPELLSYDKLLYVRSDEPHRDAQSCYVSNPERIFEINQAVREYNEKHGGHRV